MHTFCILSGFWAFRRTHNVIRVLTRDFQQGGMCDQQRLRPACANAQLGQSLCLSVEYSMIVKLLTEQPLEFLSSKGRSTGSSKSIPVKIVGNHMSRLNIFQTFIERIVLKTKCLNLAFQMFNPIRSSCIHVNIRLCDYPSFHWRHIIYT